MNASGILGMFVYKKEAEEVLTGLDICECEIKWKMTLREWVECELKEKETKTICSFNALYRKLKMSET